MNLADALEQRAERGTHGSPATRIATARSRVGSVSEGSVARELIELYPVVAVPHRRRTMMLAAAATVLVLVGVGAALAQRRPTTASTSLTSDPPSKPQPVTPEARAAALAACPTEVLVTVPAGTLTETIAVTDSIVDIRAEGHFVGLLFSNGLARDCVNPPNGVFYNKGGAHSIDLSAPTVALPLTVIDAKGPDGNMIDGNEMTWVWGRLDPSVARVVITTPTSSYEATIEHGQYAAVWKGNNGHRAIIRAFDAAGQEIAFIDQFNCTAPDPNPTDPSGPTSWLPSPRLVVAGSYVKGGCPAGHNAAPGAGASTNRVAPDWVMEFHGVVHPLSQGWRLSRPVVLPFEDQVWTVTITNSQFNVVVRGAARADLNTFRNVVMSQVRGIVDALGFHLGAVLTPELQGAIVLSPGGPDDPILTFHVGWSPLTGQAPCAPLEVSGEMLNPFIFAASNSSEIRSALSDLSMGLERPDDSAFYANRAVESARQYFRRPTDASNKEEVLWARLRETLKLDKDQLKQLSASANARRHGQVIEITEQQRIEALQLARDVIARLVAHHNDAVATSVTPRATDDRSSDAQQIDQ